MHGVLEGWAHRFTCIPSGEFPTSSDSDSDSDSASDILVGCTGTPRGRMGRNTIQEDCFYLLSCRIISLLKAPSVESRYVRCEGFTGNFCAD